MAVWLLPFIRPAHVRAVYPDAEITSYTQAVQTALAQAAPAADRQVLVAHQFVTGAAPSAEAASGRSKISSLFSMLLSPFLFFVQHSLCPLQYSEIISCCQLLLSL